MFIFVQIWMWYSSFQVQITPQHRPQSSTSHTVEGKKATQGTATHNLYRRERLRLARAHIRFTRIQLSSADGRKWVWRRCNEWYTDACNIQYNRCGGGSLHLWAGVTQFQKMVIFQRNMNANVYINNVLRPAVFDWTALSPDMSPIEHVWDTLKQRLTMQV